jgi:hypothetical protein
VLLENLDGLGVKIKSRYGDLPRRRGHELGCWNDAFADKTENRGDGAARSKITVASLTIQNKPGPERSTSKKCPEARPASPRA